MPSVEVPRSGGAAARGWRWGCLPEGEVPPDNQIIQW